MSTPTSEVIKNLALTRAHETIDTALQQATLDKRLAILAYNPEHRVYISRRLLKNPKCTHYEKLAILAANQEDRLLFIKLLQQHTLDHVFCTKPNFATKAYHYDWWVFPMYVPPKWHWPERNYHASISEEEAKILLTDKEFINTYLRCIRCYLEALNKEEKWNGWIVRYARMLHSIALFLKVALSMDNLELVARLTKAADKSIEHAEKQGFNKYYSDNRLFVDGFKAVTTLKSQIEEALKSEEAAIASATPSA